MCGRNRGTKLITVVDNAQITPYLNIYTDCLGTYPYFDEKLCVICVLCSVYYHRHK